MPLTMVPDLIFLIPLDSYKNAFQVVNPKKSFIVCANTLEEKVDWMIDITTCIDEMKSKKDTFKTAAVNQGGENAKRGDR